jgi:uncharacterized membrane protein YqhA
MGIDVRNKFFTQHKKITASISAFIFSSSLLSTTFIAAPAANAWSSAQTTVSVFGGSLSNVGNSVDVDSAGNIYTTGYFNGTADFDPGAGVTNFTSAGGTDVFVSKLNSSGDLVWAKSFGGSSTDTGTAIAVDISGNVYITGPFVGTVDFDPSAGVANLTSVGGLDSFVLKLNSSGAFVWAKSFGGVENEYGLSIAVDSNGNVYTTGDFYNTVDFDPSAGVTNLTSVGSNDVFVSKLNSSGALVWAKSVGGGSFDAGKSINVDSAGNVYTTGYFAGISDFDPDVVGVTNLTSAGEADVFVSKLDSTGNFVWAKSFGGISNDLGYSIAVDSSGNVYTTGVFSGTADFNPGAEVTNLISVGATANFVSKLDSTGAFAWAKSFSGDAVGISIAVDSSGIVYTTGYFVGTVDFDTDAGVTNLASVGPVDIFVSKLNSSGAYVWAKSFGGSLNGVGRSIAVDSSGNVYTTGFFYGTIDFDPGAGTTNLTSAGQDDVFVSKLNSLGEATLSNDSDKSAEEARKAEAARKAAAAAAEAARKQRELTELLSVIPSIAGLALSIGDLTNSLLLTKCVKGKTVKNVKKGAKCPKGYKKNK